MKTMKNMLAWIREFLAQLGAGKLALYGVAPAAGYPAYSGTFIPSL